MSARDRMPTLYEVLNRFSAAPVDLWSFYVFLNEHYGGGEYLEFWLEAAKYKSMCRNYGKQKMASGSHLQYSRGSRGSRLSRGSTNIAGIGIGISGLSDAPNRPSEINGSNGSNGSNRSHKSNRVDDSASHGDIHGHSRADSHMLQGTRGDLDDHLNHGDSPTSSMLFDMLRDDVLDSSLEHEADKFAEAHDLGVQNNGSDNISVERRRAQQQSRNMQTPQQVLRHSAKSQDLDNMYNGDFHATATASTANLAQPSRRDTVARLSALLDTLHPRKEPTDPMDPMNHVDQLNKIDQLGIQENGKHARNLSGISHASNGYTDGNIKEANGYEPIKQTPMSLELLGQSDPSSLQIGETVTKRDIRDCCQRIIVTYLAPGAVRELSLPADTNGWSMAASIRQLAGIPGGIDNPKIFDEAMEYVFSVLEREAYPCFLSNRALANVQPVSSSLRVSVGLVGIFGAFWLGFVYILLDWSPKYHRCWVILPFGVGWYLLLSGLYRMDPVLGLAGFGEADGSIKLERICEPYVRHLILTRSLFIVTAIVLIAAAFCVIFIFVPGHRL